MEQEKNKVTGNLSRNLSFLLKQQGIDIKTLAAATNLPPATISRMKSGESNPTVASLLPLVKFFKISIDTLLYEDLSSHKNKTKSSASNLTQVPMYEIGKDGLMQNRNKIIRFVSSIGLQSKNCFAMDIQTEALSPVFRYGCTIIIDPDLDAHDGDYILCMLKDDPIPVFRGVLIDGSSYFLKPINPNFGDIIHATDFKVLGVIVKSISTFRET